MLIGYTLPVETPESCELIPYTVWTLARARTSRPGTSPSSPRFSTSLSGARACLSSSDANDLNPAPGLRTAMSLVAIQAYAFCNGLVLGKFSVAKRLLEPDPHGPA